MWRPVVRRVALSVPLLFMVSIMIYLVTALTPGDPGRTILGLEATADAVAEINARLGLDQPLPVQYAAWLGRALSGDFGSSFISRVPVSRLIASAAPITITLVIGAVLVAVAVGVPLGVLAARKKGTALGQTVDLIAIIGYALPAFWLGYMLVFVFALNLDIAPSSGWIPINVSFTGWLGSIWLPILTLSAAGIGAIARQTRDQMISAMDRPFIRALRGRGTPESSIIAKHALRSALPVVVMQVATYVVSLVVGATLVETVFGLQGLGSLAVSATSGHDLPVLQGVAVAFTLIIIVTFLISEVVSAWLNPRLRSAR